MKGKTKRIGSIFLALSIIISTMVPNIAIAENETDLMNNNIESNLSIKDEALILSEVASDHKALNQDEIKLAEELSNYFELDANENLIFTADKETLMELGISENDAKIMTSINPGELSIDSIESTEGIQTYGFVGLHFNIGPQTRKMTGTGAGLFATGAAAYQLRRIAALGIIGAGSVAVISGGIGAAVGYAVNKGFRTARVGVNIAFANAVFTVNLP